MCHVVTLARWVVRGSGAVGVAAIVLRGRSQSLRGRMLGAGRRLPVVVVVVVGSRSGLWWCGSRDVACRRLGGRRRGC